MTEAVLQAESKELQVEIHIHINKQKHLYKLLCYYERINIYFLLSSLN